MLKKDKKEDIKWMEIKGARTHNLKNLSVKIPREKMTVITGLSGSGKSSLAFDTIFAEGQRRYVESLSAYARQFLSQMQKADVDEIKGLSPSISIDQKSTSSNPRSTVATITEIYDYLRLLYARVGKVYCPLCGTLISKLSVQQMYNFVIQKTKKKVEKIKNEKKDFSFDDFKIKLYAPVVRQKKGQFYQMLYNFLSQGYAEVRIDGKKKSLRNRIILDPKKKHDIELLLDTFSFQDFLSGNKEQEKEIQSYFFESVQKALELSDGLALFVFDSPKACEEETEELLLSSNFSCPKDAFSFGEIQPRIFSFNSPLGACPDCKGLGFEFFGSNKPCESCEGKRLKDSSLCILLPSKSEKFSANLSPLKTFGKDKKALSIADFCALNVNEALDFLEELTLQEAEKKIAEILIKEIKERLDFIKNVGIDYLTLDRRANTLSGGEAQRIRLASQLGSNLVGATYILDEPTIGLHQKDNDRLIKTLEKLKNLGNTVIVVEHDEDVIFSADYLIDIGPGAGEGGGKVTASGFLDKLLKEKKTSSLTLKYLKEERKIEVPEKRRKSDKGWIKVVGANVFNIKNQNVEIPLQKFVCITGLSGSGKSSFMYEVLHKNLKSFFASKKRDFDFKNCAKISGFENLTKAVLIDQSPIGRTPRSNPATYTGAFTYIRELFAGSTEGAIRGYKPGQFSFNVPGGRCEACSGNGYIKVEMHFLPDVYVQCSVCKGKRFNKETLEVKYKKKNIAEVLDMSILEAYDFFKDIPAVADRLKALRDVSLGYLKLGQSATTLSGGEAQRVKIASELFRPFLHKAIYLLDEPTVGLHFEDVKKLIDILQKLVDKGNTVVVIEHNLDLIKSSDYILEFGPEGGEKGGRIVAKGSPEQVVEMKNSPSSKYLKRVLRK